jgi:hypothetical protein
METYPQTNRHLTVKIDQTRRQNRSLHLKLERAQGFAYVGNALGMSMALAVPKLLAALPFSLQ